MKRIFCLLFFLLLSQVAVAGVESDAEKALKTSVNAVLNVLAEEGLTLDQKKSKVVEITNTIFDYSLMARLSLGKEYWARFKPGQRTQFANLFIKQFQDFYVDKIDLFNDEKVDFLPPIMVEKKKVKIPTVLLSKDKKYSILYMMFKTESGWRIYDISIEGVSILHTYRKQYHHILASEGVEDLLTKMREKKIENGES